MNTSISQSTALIANSLNISDPELINYWKLIKTVESLGFCKTYNNTLDVNFDISYGEDNDFTLIRVHRTYIPDKRDRIIVSDLVHDFPPSTQPKAVNFYVTKNDTGKIIVSPYKETTVPDEIITLMKKVGSFSLTEEAKLVVRPLLKQLKEFVFKNGKWESLLPQF